MKTRRFLLAALFILSLGSLITCPFLGISDIPIASVFQSVKSTEGNIFWNIRLPRVCLGFLTGGSLALVGMVYQAMFRNMLASPFTLGVASGAAFGVSLYYRIGISLPFLGLGGGAFAAFGGAIATMLIVASIAGPSQGGSPTHMLLAGVIVSFFFSSLVLLLQYLSDSTEVFQMTRWLMGSLDVVGFDSFLGVLPFVLLGLIPLFLLGNTLDLLSLGDDLAQSRGLVVQKARWILFIASSLVVGAFVSVCGPIGFVGLIVPYVCRSLLGSRHRILSIACFLLGGTFLITCDTFSRVAFAPAEIPVGVVTALLGGPFFLWLVRRGRLDRVG